MHVSAGDGIVFSGGTATCTRCVASGSAGTGLRWERGWRGGATGLFVQQGPGGGSGLVGDNDTEGYDLEPRSRPVIARATIVGPGSDRRGGNEAVGLLLRSGSAIDANSLVVTGFSGGALQALGRSAQLFTEGESQWMGALLHPDPRADSPSGLPEGLEYVSANPRLQDIRYFPNPDPRPSESPPEPLGTADEGYLGAFDRERNWLDEWISFGTPEATWQRVLSRTVRDGWSAGAAHTDTDAADELFPSPR